MTDETDHSKQAATGTPAPADSSDGALAPVPSRLEQMLPLVSRSGLVALVLLLGGYASTLVFQERWLMLPNIRDSQMETWCRVDFLCRTALPSYFVIVLPVIAFMLAVLLAFMPPHPDSFARPQPDTPPAAGIPGVTQTRTGRGLQYLALLITATSLLLYLFFQRVPAGEIALALLCLLAGQALVWLPLEKLASAAKSLPGWLLPYALLHLGFILALTAQANRTPGAPLFWLLLALLLIFLRGWLKQVPVVLWVMLLALALMTIQIGSWRFSIVGDEYSFFSLGREILAKSPGYIFNRLFDGSGVYGSHPFFSSLLQAASMRLLGEGNFGWRFSSIYLAALSIPLLYLFLRRHIEKPTALLTAGLLALSTYLMSFARIGYNNPQALLALALVLWLAGEASRHRDPLRYSLLGASLALCFYVYPAALYIPPLAIIYLLFFDPPFERTALRRWVYLLPSFSLLFLPLIFQPGYWQEKLAGTFMNNPTIFEQGQGIYHFGSNLLYSLFTYLYIPDETHFVVVSHLDLISAIFVPIGLARLVRLAPRHKFAGFLLVLGAYLLVTVGITHDRQFPTNTRMFLLLPLWTLLAAGGIRWVWLELAACRVPANWQRWGLAILLGSIAILNLLQTYPLAAARMVGDPNLEVLFLRWLQYDQQQPQRSSGVYVFITEEDWGIDGIRLLRDVYRLPESQAQLKRLVATGETLSESDLIRLADEDVFVIVQPWMAEDRRTAIEQHLAALGKRPCSIQNAPSVSPRFTLWMPPGRFDSCPAGGVW
ncbi:MAG: hypothetical protein HPY76_01620 [Anaerolineae bacterium]|nr:hypothetical protein [Anaerolineae bacterium]